MQNERPETGELANFAARLAALKPRAEIDRDRLMFEAGGRAARKRLLVANRLLGAACVLLAVTTLVPVVAPRPADSIAKEAPKARVQVVEPPSSEALKELPNQLAVADSRELAMAIAEGRSDLRPARLREQVDPPRGAIRENGASSRPKPSRELLREYLQAGDERL